MTRELDFLHFPLHGSQLIEASAGTGKTFTLALLYTRLVLGHGARGCAYKRPLTPDEILVVTFTEAAAEELRDRIRARLVQAADYFSERQAPLPASDPLEQLRSTYPPQSWIDCAWRLRSAAQAMDEACISTIHGWCNRVLLEHAFDTRGLFQRELLTDLEPVRGEVVRDYWRQTFYPLDARQAELVSRHFSTPEALHTALRDLLGLATRGSSFSGQALEVPSLTPVLQQLQQAQQQKRADEARLKQLWLEQQDEIHEQLQALRPYLNGSIHDSAQPAKFNALLENIDAWCHSAPGTPLPKKLEHFAIDRFRFKKDKEQPVPPLPVFEALKDYRETWQETDDGPDLRACILAHARERVQKLLRQRLQQRAAMGFDDLLRHLAEALDPAHSGHHATHLATQLRNSFPVALIDEFQDTDPVQYHIFNSIYQVAENRPDYGLFMIGDPKQAIYSFRGADIHTYLQARADTTGRHHTLPRNFRSTAAVVQACNDLFNFAEQQSLGAFRFREAQQDPVPFNPVSAAGRRESLHLCNQPAAAMRLNYFRPPDAGAVLSQTDYRQSAATQVAAEITHWLHAAQQGQSGFFLEGKLQRALRPADIAILVRSAREAQLVRRALDQVGVASVYLSDRESVFETREAQDVLHWLMACAEPTSERRVKTALATNSCCLPLSLLARWQDDELLWEARMQQFMTLHQLWRRQGVLAMLRRLLEQLELPTRLLQQPDGERRLTNLLHLAEWLQQASTELDGEQALIRHLREHLNKADQQQLLRLESDAERVQVITIHKSKGLEYPLVLLPFIAGWFQRPSQAKQVPWRLQGQLYRELAPRKTFPDAWEAADDERLSEDMRLLYVALTRASHALWLGVAPLTSGRNSTPQLHQAAWGYLLNGSQPLPDDNAVWSAFEALANTSPMIQLQEASTLTPKPLPASSSSALEAARPAPQLGSLDNWWIASYSAISARLSPGERLQHDAQQARDERQDELSDEALTPLPSIGAEGTGDSMHPVLHQLPAGASWGTFLHGILEWAARHQYLHPETGLCRGFAAAAADHSTRNRLLQRRCEQRGIAELAPALSDWLLALLALPLTLTTDDGNNVTGSPLQLLALQPAQCSVEMEFLLPSQKVPARTLDQWITRHTLQSAPRPALEPLQLNGMLKGFIDLVFEHEGRYFVLDWKSNRLGADSSAYALETLKATVLAKRYDLQYVLYLLALHRQLRARLPGYDYDQHIGGAVYVFLRGMQHPQTRGLFVERPPRQLIESLDRLFRGEALDANLEVTA